MRRPTAITGFLLVLAVAVAGCGAGEATRASVADRVQAFLLANVDGLSEDEAATRADCVSDRMFDGETFTPDERNAITRVLDSDPADPDLAARVVALVEGCDAVAPGIDPGVEGTGTTERGGGATTTTAG